MARKIVGVIQPFDMKQNIYVYEDGNKIDGAYIKLDNINDSILGFANKYNINQVDLIGPKQYLKGLARKLQEQELNTYSQNNIVVTII